MTASDGYIKTYRSIKKYGKDPIRLKAWLYLLLDAKWNGNDIGKVEATWTELAVSWELFKKNGKKGICPDIQKVQRFIKEMVKDRRVEVQYPDDTQTAPEQYPLLSIFIINYPKLQGKETPHDTQVAPKWHPSGTHDEINPIPEPLPESLIIKNKEEEVHTEKKEKRGSVRGRKTPPSQPPPPPKNVEEIQEALEKIDLDEFQKSYPTLDVPKFFKEDFSYKMLYGTPKKDGVNPYDYVNFKLAFRTWCKKAEATGEYPKTAEDDSKTGIWAMSYAERQEHYKKVSEEENRLWEINYKKQLELEKENSK